MVMNLNQILVKSQWVNSDSSLDPVSCCCSFDWCWHASNGLKAEKPYPHDSLGKNYGI
jgi:hypothetical protein